MNEMEKRFDEKFPDVIVGFYDGVNKPVYKKMGNQVKQFIREETKRDVEESIYEVMKDVLKYNTGTKTVKADTDRLCSNRKQVLMKFKIEEY